MSGAERLWWNRRWKLFLDRLLDRPRRHVFAEVRWTYDGREFSEKECRLCGFRQSLETVDLNPSCFPSRSLKETP